MLTNIRNFVQQIQNTLKHNKENQRILLTPKYNKESQSIPPTPKHNKESQPISPTPKHNNIAQQRIQAAKEQQLIELNLNQLGLTDIPPEVFSLTHLKALNLGRNQLSTLPPEIGQLQNLTSLYLYNNQLSTLPPEIGQLQNLIGLTLDNNKLNILPPEIDQLQNLLVLSLSNNQLSTLPPEIAHLKKLKTLYLDGNPLETPSLEVLDLNIGRQANIQKLKAYFRQRETEGSGLLYEAKLLIVGEPGAGKTTLAEKIKDFEYELKNEITTHGIEIRKWAFKFTPDTEQQTFDVNIWDFGGQEIYHATHQFFLTKRSLYLLIADSRKEDTDFNYWLSVAALLSDNSPLLIIKNEKDDRQRAINESQLRERFSNLKDNLATNLATNRGLPEILDAIQYHISHLPHVGAILPKTWVKVRAALEKDSRHYINITDYRQICQQHGIKRPDDQLQLSDYLHDLGVCLHFQEDPLLEKTIILKPEWATSAVYKILDDITVINKHGQFDINDLKRILHHPEYIDMYSEILQLMLNFKLCYPLKTKHTYLVPQLLSADKAEYPWPQNQQTLLLRYEYGFMPKGILTQFIVATQHLIAKQDWVWKNGVILAKEDTLAEVIEDYDNRKIMVRVAGIHKRDLLTIVNHELEKIHAAYNRLQYDKLTPCPCSTCTEQAEPHFYTVQHLRRFIAKNIADVQCPEGGEMIKVRPLLDDVVGEELLDSTPLNQEQQKLYQAYKQRLQQLKLKSATLGINTPAEILIEIKDIEQELKRLL